MEIFKTIKGYEGLYEISNYGRCKSYTRSKKGTIIKPIVCSNGYLEYHLHKDGKRKCFMAHRLVAEAFIPNPNNKPQVNHIDEDIQNNMIDNLEWCTAKENANHGTRNERSIKNHNYNRIIQLTLNDEYITTYDNAEIAAAAVGLTGSSCIIRCCKGTQNQSRNYKWKYEKDYLNN